MRQGKRKPGSESSGPVSDVEPVLLKKARLRLNRHQLAFQSVSFMATMLKVTWSMLSARLATGVPSCTANSRICMVEQRTVPMYIERQAGSAPAQIRRPRRHRPYTLAPQACLPMPASLIAAVQHALSSHMSTPIAWFVAAAHARYNSSFLSFARSSGVTGQFSSSAAQHTRVRPIHVPVMQVPGATALTPIAAVNGERDPIQPVHATSCTISECAHRPRRCATCTRRLPEHPVRHDCASSTERRGGVKHRPWRHGMNSHALHCRICGYVPVHAVRRSTVVEHVRVVVRIARSEAAIQRHTLSQRTE